MLKEGQEKHDEEDNHDSFQGEPERILKRLFQILLFFHHLPQDKEKDRTADDRPVPSQKAAQIA